MAATQDMDSGNFFFDPATREHAIRSFAAAIRRGEVELDSDESVEESFSFVSHIFALSFRLIDSHDAGESELQRSSRLSREASADREEWQEGAVEAIAAIFATAPPSVVSRVLVQNDTVALILLELLNVISNSAPSSIASGSASAAQAGGGAKRFGVSFRMAAAACCRDIISRLPVASVRRMVPGMVSRIAAEISGMLSANPSCIGRASTTNRSAPFDDVHDYHPGIVVVPTPDIGKAASSGPTSAIAGGGRQLEALFSSLLDCLTVSLERSLLDDVSAHPQGAVAILTNLPRVLTAMVSRIETTILKVCAEGPLNFAVSPRGESLPIVFSRLVCCLLAAARCHALLLSEDTERSSGSGLPTASDGRHETMGPVAIMCRDAVGTALTALGAAKQFPSHPSSLSVHHQRLRELIEWSGLVGTDCVRGAFEIVTRDGHLLLRVWGWEYLRGIAFNPSPSDSASPCQRPGYVPLIDGRTAVDCALRHFTKTVCATDADTGRFIRRLISLTSRSGTEASQTEADCSGIPTVLNELWITDATLEMLNRQQQGAPREEAAEDYLHIILDDWFSYHKHLAALYCLVRLAQGRWRHRRGEISGASDYADDFVYGGEWDAVWSTAFLRTPHVWQIDEDAELCSSQQITHRCHLLVCGIFGLSRALNEALTPGDAAASGVAAIDRFAQLPLCSQHCLSQCLFEVLRCVVCPYGENVRDAARACVRFVASRLHIEEPIRFFTAASDYVIEAAINEMSYGSPAGGAQILSGMMEIVCDAVGAALRGPGSDAPSAWEGAESLLPELLLAVATAAHNGLRRLMAEGLKSCSDGVSHDVLDDERGLLRLLILVGKATGNLQRWIDQTLKGVRMHFGPPDLNGLIEPSDGQYPARLPPSVAKLQGYLVGVVDTCVQISIAPRQRSNPTGSGDWLTLSARKHESTWNSALSNIVAGGGNRHGPPLLTRSGLIARNLAVEAATTILRSICSTIPDLQLVGQDEPLASGSQPHSSLLLSQSYWPLAYRCYEALLPVLLQPTAEAAPRAISDVANLFERIWPPSTAQQPSQSKAADLSLKESILRRISANRSLHRELQALKAMPCDAALIGVVRFLTDLLAAAPVFLHQRMTTDFAKVLLTRHTIHLLQCEQGRMGRYQFAAWRSSAERFFSVLLTSVPNPRQENVLRVTRCAHSVGLLTDDASKVVVAATESAADGSS